MLAAKSWLAALAVAAMPAFAGQYTDLWWNPNESGWGMNLVQEDESAFLTLFVYGPDGKPTWYVSSDARVTAYSGAAGLPLFHGGLYKTEGPWHAGPFDPTQVRVTRVGDVWLEALAKDRLNLWYRVDGITVSRELRRQTIAEIPVSTTYASQFVLRLARPGEGPFGISHYQAELQLHFDAGQGFMRTDDHLGRRCEYRGPYRQAGKLLRFQGEFSCSAGDALAGTFDLMDLEVTPHGITGYLRTSSPALQQYGRFAAARF